MNRILAVGVVVAAIAVGALWWISGQGPAPGLDLPAAAHADEGNADLSLAPDMTLGNPDAPVTVIEYASFTCPHCASFHAGAYQQLKSDYIDTGKINFVYREVYFDKFGLWAGLLARCGDTTERYFALTDLIYSNQKAWTRADSEQGIAGNLMQLGRTAGFTEDKLQACMQDSARAEAMVAAYQKNATADGVRSTPSFVINGKLYGNMDYSELQRILAEAGAN